jgi:GH24 family phage-related lysozyme (muramidase)
MEPFSTNFRNKLEQYEGRIAWMYLDGPGNVTCGIGHLLATPQDAGKIEWSGDDPVAAWQSVKQSPPGRNATTYQGLNSCRLSDAVIDSVCAQDVANATAQLRAFLPSVDSLPQPVQQALLDMAFNLGVPRLHAEYFGPNCHFGPAILRGDWTTAAAESARRGIQPERNQYTAELILSALG